jgi:hypothetical protein
MSGGDCVSSRKQIDGQLSPIIPKIFTLPLPYFIYRTVLHPFTVSFDSRQSSCRQFVTGSSCPPAPFGGIVIRSASLS